MSDTLLYQFETANADGVVDPENAVIHGVSMITGGLTAKGHDLEVDAKTLKQIFLCAKAKGQVPVKTNHGSGVDAVNGYLTNFRIDGDKVRGDWHLLKTHPQASHLLEMAERMPSSVGLSVAFHGNPETTDGKACLFDEQVKQYYTVGEGGKKNYLAPGTKKHARCTELVSTDLVASPAANPEGMFSARPVDSASGGMANTATPSASAPASANTAEPTLADVMKAIQGLTQRMDQIEAGADGNDAAEQLSEEEIQAGLESGQLVDNGDGTYTVVAEDGDGEGEGEGEGGEGEGEGEGSPAEVAQAALAAGNLPAYLDAKFAEMAQAFDARLREKEQAKAAKQAMNEFTAKTVKLTEFAEQAAAENVALRELLAEKEAALAAFEAKKPSGGGESHLFDAKKKEGVTTFESVVAEKLAALSSNKELTEFGRKAEATKQAIDARPDLYADYQKRNGTRRD
jgi:hypothetical protein